MNRQTPFSGSAPAAFRPPPWNVIKVGNRKEKTVARQLSALGVEHYLPLRERQYRYSSKRVLRQLPIIPGYVFVRAQPRQLAAVLSVPFVFDYLRDETGPCTIREEEMQRLRYLSSADSLNWVDEAEAAAALTAGTPVEIIRGPLAGVRGYFVAHNRKNQFLISFSHLRTQLSTYEVAAADVLPLADESAPGRAAA